MRRILTISIAAAALAVAAPAGAGQPVNPGCFGQDRAAALHDVFQASDTSPGASEWGHIAGERAGMNGQINRDYRVLCGGVPTMK